MAKFIVNTGKEKVVHRATHTKPDCNINLISTANRIDTYVDYTVLYPSMYTTCTHCNPVEETTVPIENLAADRELNSYHS
ncbi:hypothetical protein [Evansella tamaricis]|uniref:Uncharacterized protein n=1 Tax=Evansella tamaricis TaxID=2069301 RepID=A0ABS6JGI1_9BACI|nr:hypothetical protein [Evansella tamaricis]MBU9712753.1 hypothetical protein [Evansella tamaricis]